MPRFEVLIDDQEILHMYHANTRIGLDPPLTSEAQSAIIEDMSHHDFGRNRLFSVFTNAASDNCIIQSGLWEEPNL